MATLTTTTFPTTYKDDFADSANFHKILFNSGKALQARELTQLQTILQNQISRFGNNIFKEGAVVKPGGATINQKYEFVKLNTSSNTLPPDTSTLLGRTFVGQTSQIAAKILQVVPAENSDPDTLYVQYTSTKNATPGTTTLRFFAGEDIAEGSDTLTVQTTDTVDDPATGVGILITLLSGVYYARGHFVFTEDQTKIISKYKDFVDTDVGFKSVESIVTSSDDTNLFDNQGAVPNVAAPGADRYKIKLTIAERSEINSDENFIHVATVKEGVVYNAVSADDAYNVPNKVVAKRIFENSGDYFVKPFSARFRPDSADTHLKLEVSAGTAVVDGFRASRDFPTTLRVQKSTQTIVISNDVTGADFGNFVVVDNSAVGDAVTAGLPNINVFEKMNLRDSIGHLGSTIGTARVKAVNEGTGTDLNFHLFDIKMNSGQAFRSVKSIGTSTSNYFNPTLENGKAVLKEASRNGSLFRLSHIRPQSLSTISFAVQRRIPVTSNGAGEATVTTPEANETLVNADDWIISKADSDIFLAGNVSGITSGSSSGTITGLPANAAIEVLAYVNKSPATIKTKTLTVKSIVAAMDSDGLGQKFLPLKTPDIIEVDEILKEGDSNISYSNRFTLDNGQRDNHYDLGRLLLKSGSSAPGNNVFIKFRHFTHSQNGDFFAVNSYSGQVDYQQIPSYTKASGQKIMLFNYLDFRSVMDSDGEFATTSSGARVIELPQPTQLVQHSSTYFLPRVGRLVIDREGVIRFIAGNAGFNPTLPLKPDGTLGLYNVRLNPNTLNESDASMTKINHKRFTMKDIGLLEKRIDKLEEVATLSALELDTKHFQVLDSAGNDRTKSGFFVDNFLDATQSETSTNEYRAALDPIDNIIRPIGIEDNVRLVYDSADSKTENGGVMKTVRKGDNIYINYDQQPYINQNLATKDIRVNPFSVVFYEGVLTMSPASDEWRDVNINSERTVPGGTRLSTSQAYNWNNWSWNWGGIPIENLSIGNQTNTNEGTVNRVVGEETIQEFKEDRVIESALLPFMRSRKVFFKAEGLRPNTRVFPIFDGNLVSDYVRQETFQFYSDDGTDFGNTLAGVTTHPDGSTNLTTNAEGEVAGSFIVPNNDTIRVRTGDREFKLLDVSIDNEAGASVIAKHIYTATGYLDTVDRTYASTRVLEVQGVRLSDEATYNNSSDGDGNDNAGGGTVISEENHVGGGTFSNDHSNNAGDDPTGNTSGNPGDPNAGLDDPAAADNSGGGGGGGTHCCSASRQRGDMTYMEVQKLRVWHRRQSMIWQEGYDVWGKVIADKCVKKSKWWSDRVRDFHDDKILGKKSLGSVFANFVIVPMSMAIGVYKLTKKKFENKRNLRWQ